MTKEVKYFWLGIPVLFSLGSFFHFLYGLSGEMFAVGMFAPVNESIFEHTKLFPLPAVICFVSFYFIRKNEINADKWFTSALVSIVTQALSMVLLYYFYTGAFGVKSVKVDIATFFVTVSIAQIVGLHFYKYAKWLDCRLSISLIAAILVAFALLTVYPPHLPMFLDPVTGSGI